MLFLSQRTCRRLFLAGAIASSLVFSNHALAASPEHIAPLAILSTADGTTVDLTNIILHDGSGVPIPKDATMAVYVATTAPVSSLHFSGIDMYGSGGVLDYAYQDGNGFQPLTVTTDSGASFTRTRADGTADVTFALPASWSTTTLAEDSLHRSAYWIRITARTPYEKIPFVKKLDATVFTTQATFVQDSFGGYNGLVRATPTAGCGSDAAVLREAAATNGVHWFVVRTSAPTCTLTVSPPGFLSTTFSAKTFTGAAQTVTASIPLQHRMVVTVLDEQGLPVSDAYPSFDGLLPDAQQGGKYYFGNEDTVNARLIVRRSGYVTEDGHGQNSALYHISGGTAYQQTTIIFTPNSPACSSAIVPGVITYCALMTPNTTVVTLDSGRATSTAAVTIYTDAARTTMADDVSRIGSNDAGFISNSNGEMTFALREGTYYYIATALGAPATIGNFIVLPDVPTTLKVDYWPQAPLNPTVSPTASSVRVYGPNAVYADRDAVLVVITVKEGASYRLPDSTLQISVSSTISVAPTTPAANDVAEWYLALRSTRPAFTHIFATADDIALADAPILTFLTPPPIQDGRVSATQSLVAISGNSAPADNSTVRTLTVTVRNAGPSVISGKTVSIATACTGVTIQPSTAMTDSTGVASFTIKGSVADDCIFS
ncbi:Ig-like domain-containing protein, partial [Patescibacteria group bacterium]|nr:Ig-like domain-containing protein [Patescibacteria group bacterium]